MSYFDARKFWCVFVPAILKTNPFSHHLSKYNFIKIWTFSAFWYISEANRTNLFQKSLHIIFIMYIIMSETFIKIDSLQHLEISRQAYPTYRSKIRATAFTVLTLR